MTVTEFTLAHYDQVIELWRRTPGISLHDADSREGMARYLARNPGFSFIALSVDHRVIGSALGSHDGRRGFIQHVAVDVPFRRQGIARTLVTRCLEALAAEQIFKIHLDVLASNEYALNYWQRQGWTPRHDIRRYSHTHPDHPNA